jgi:hypothetical protein
MTKTCNQYAITKIGTKFVVTKNGNPIILPSSVGTTIITEFEHKSDAERYMGILKTLKTRT